MSDIKLHPEEFELECTTVWAFPRRGNWATHKSDWRGNWSPEVARNLILRYSKGLFAEVSGNAGGNG